MIDSIRPRKAIPKTSREQLSNLAEREIDNSKKMIGNLQYDISKLQEKYAKFVDSHEEEELVKKIKSTKS
jgi:quinol monooxygenase YgiN